MPYDGNEGRFITLPEAELITREYRDRHPNATRAYYVGKNKLQELIDQPGCVGIRIYRGLQANQAQAVIVGVNSDEQDMTTGLLLDEVFACPANCDPGSSLNQ